ncbi:hypothetical protein NDU88_004988 [Pleurodeles waltl]|uniref:Uncharacterized protein n=1 Tax=Pleurodeles waltl TaxID=8319 RepID=A0AAV7MZZ0_PLEWA|nr:hypothetical protein NDU88_004988 [Pleurodeles waltl]
MPSPRRRLTAQSGECMGRRRGHGASSTAGAQRLNGGGELRCVDRAASASPEQLDVRCPTPSEEVKAPQTGCL